MASVNGTSSITMREWWRWDLAPRRGPGLAGRAASGTRRARPGGSGAAAAACVGLQEFRRTGRGVTAGWLGWARDWAAAIETLATSRRDSDKEVLSFC